MKTIDFYQGYEGEPEFILTRRARSGIDSCILRLWDGYFHDIIEQIPPGTDGNWQGVTLHHHVNSFWDGREWECLDLPLFHSQLMTIDPGKLRLGNETVLEAMKTLVKDCLVNQERLFIQRD